MKRFFKVLLLALVLIATPSCATRIDNGFEAELDVLLIGFEEEQVTLILDEEIVYQKYIKESHPNFGVSDRILLSVGRGFSLSVVSKSTSIKEVIEIFEDTTVLIVKGAGGFIMQSTSEPLLLD